MLRSDQIGKMWYTGKTDWDRGREKEVSVLTDWFWVVILSG